MGTREQRGRACLLPHVDRVSRRPHLWATGSLFGTLCVKMMNTAVDRSRLLKPPAPPPRPRRGTPSPTSPPKPRQGTPSPAPKDTTPRDTPGDTPPPRPRRETPSPTPKDSTPRDTPRDSPLMHQRHPNDLQNQLIALIGNIPTENTDSDPFSNTDTIKTVFQNLLQSKTFGLEYPAVRQALVDGFKGETTFRVVKEVRRINMSPLPLSGDQLLDNGSRSPSLSRK